ncbi:hypothetical protein CR513_61981, partial [Mucuna pruriens]
MELQHYRNLSELVHQAIKEEYTRKAYGGSSGWKGKEREKDRARREKSPKKGSKPSISRKELTPMPPRTSSIKCFKCLEKRYINSQCPNKSVMIVKDDGEIGSENSVRKVSTSSKSESLSDGSHYEGDLLVVRRLMNSNVRGEAKTQRENIFYSRWGSCVNVASKRLVKKLALPTIVHPRSYMLQGIIKKGKFLVDRQVVVIFTLGGYEGRVVCNVVPMEATHLLLRRPLQFDKKVIQDGVTNHITFIHIGQKVVLKPLSPSVVQGDQKKMNMERESERRTKCEMTTKKGA